MDLKTEIAAINAAPLSQDQKNCIITKLILDAAAGPPEVDPAVAVAAAQKANMAALRGTGGASSYVAGTGGVSAKQTDAVLAAALRYVPTPARDVDRQNPPKYAMEQFRAAGLQDVTAPNGPVDRWGPAMAVYHL